MTIRITSNRLRLIIGGIIWLITIYWFVRVWGNRANDPNAVFEPLIGVVAGLGFLIDWAELRRQEGDDRPGQPAYQLDIPLDRQNRANLLKLTRTIWQDEFLEQALHRTVWLDLPKREAPHLLARPTMLLRVPARPDTPLPPHTSLRALFDERGRALLILGAPGSGKSVTLAELGVALLDAADADPQQPAPVILNLTSWDGKETVDAWLERRLQREYTLPPAVTRAWLEAGRLLPLLDGLDEVAAGRRAVCLEAINIFRAARGAPYVVCSRREEYEALGARLNAGGALLIEPLEDAQIAAYLQPQPLRGVRAALEAEPELRDLARAPLFLSVLARTFYDMPPAQVAALLADPAARRRNLWDAYIQRALRHRPLADEKDSPRDALHWLAFLARQLAARDRTEFYVEELQPDWLADPWQRRYRWLSGLVVGLVFGLVFGLAFGLVGGLVVGLVGGLVVGLGGGLVVGLVVGLGDIELVEGLIWRRPAWRDIRRTIRERLWRNLSVGLFSGLFSGLVYGLVVGLVVGPVFGLVFNLLELVALAQAGAVRRAPAQGVAASARHALRMALVYGLVVGLVYGLVVDLVVGLVVGLVYGLGGGLVGGLGGGLVFGFLEYGGTAVIQHYALRRVLGWAGWLPGVRGLLPWLAAMQERLLLRRTGGSYRFLHRYLQEHCAALSAEDVERLAATLEGGVG